MLIHDLKLSYRSFIKNKSFSLVNLFGLTIAMSAFLLIWLYVSFQLSYDHFHTKKASIYQVYHKEYWQGMLTQQGSETFKEVGPTLKDNFPEVVAFTRVFRSLEQLFSKADEQEIFYNENFVYYVDSSFLQIFSFPLVKGDSLTALTQPQSAVITASTAHKYFGAQDPLGKVLYSTDAWGNEVACTITGVAKDVPPNSQLQFDILLSTDFQDNFSSDLPEYITYALLENSTDPTALSSQLTEAVNYQLGLEKQETGNTLELSMVPLTNVHFLQNASAQQSVTLLSWIAVLIMVIALINFINLSTVQSLDKVRQVGVRKILGAFQNQIIRQCALETILMHGISLVLAIALIILFRPLLANMISFPFSFHHLYPTNWSALLLFFLMAGVLVSTLYTAIFTASYKPTLVLKGKSKNSKSSITLRKILVVSQFASAILLMAGTLTMYQQLQFMRNAPLGINLEQTLIVKAPKKQVNTEQRFDTFKAKLSQHAAIATVSSTSIIPGRDIGNLVTFQKSGADENDSRVLPVIVIDPSFIDAFDVKLIHGKNFAEGDWKNWRSMLLNEYAAQLLGYQQPEDAINTEITDQSTGKKFTVIGVIQNYHQKSLKQALMPLVYRYNPNSWGYFAIKLSSPDFQSLEDIQNMIAEVAQTWENTFEGEPFDYFFLDDYFNAQYTADEKVSKIVTLFTSLAVLVACLGLFSLASYTARQRTKEIGIRKVHGASVFNILTLLSRQYVQLTLIAWAVAIPVSNFLITEWLQNFAFKVDISWWMLALPGILVLFIALLSVAGQTWKAAQTNPVDSLRYE